MFYNILFNSSAIKFFMVQKFLNLHFLLLFAFIVVNAQDSAKPKKARSFAAIPLVNYNRTQGFVVGAMISK